MTDRIHVDIASPPDRERLVAQIMVGNQQWAEVNQEGDSLQLKTYPRQDGRAWVLGFDDAIDSLAFARKRLTGE